MKNGLRIYWVKQKLVGLLLIVLPILLWDLLVVNEAALVAVVAIGMGVLIMLAQDRMFRSDYIITFKRLRRLF